MSISLTKYSVYINKMQLGTFLSHILIFYTVVCPENAELTGIIEGIMVCQCLPGYTGDPFVSCTGECVYMTMDTSLHLCQFYDKLFSTRPLM